MEHPTMRSIIDIIAEQLAIRRNFIKPESQLCKLDADESEVYTILCTIEDTFHIKWNKDKKMAMVDNELHRFFGLPVTTKDYFLFTEDDCFSNWQILASEKRSKLPTSW